MANSVIQIKRSTTDAVPANVVFGELAYTANGKVLYIGDETNTAIAIAGNRTPGVLTANQAIVVDENSIIDTAEFFTGYFFEILVRQILQAKNLNWVPPKPEVPSLV